MILNGLAKHVSIKDLATQLALNNLAYPLRRTGHIRRVFSVELLAFQELPFPDLLANGFSSPKEAGLEVWTTKTLGVAAIIWGRSTPAHGMCRIQPSAKLTYGSTNDQNKRLGWNKSPELKPQRTWKGAFFECSELLNQVLAGYLSHQKSSLCNYETWGWWSFSKILVNWLNHSLNKRTQPEIHFGLADFKRCQSGSGRFSTTHRTQTEMRCMQWGFSLQNQVVLAEDVLKTHEDESLYTFLDNHPLKNCLLVWPKEENNIIKGQEKEGRKEGTTCTNTLPVSEHLLLTDHVQFLDAVLSTRSALSVGIWAQPCEKRPLKC